MWMLASHQINVRRFSRQTEGIMTTTITINGSVTLDESLGLQNGTGTPPPGEDNDDSDVSLGTLQTGAPTFYNRLFNSSPGGLGLSTTFAFNNGVAESASNLITVSGGTVASLGFVDGNGGALPVYTPGVTDPGTGVLVTGFSTLDGGAIHLFQDATSGSGLGDRMALGVDTQGNVVFAIFMDPNAALTSARVWMVQFEAISNPVATNPDDSVNLFDSIGVAAKTTLAFDFSALHSGDNLFGTVGDVNNALIVIGEHPVLQADGTILKNSSDTISTSQGGGPTTIGVNSQMFDPGEGAYFTYVKNPNPDFLAGFQPNGLTPTEADDADNILYTGGTNPATSASTTISQTQGNALASMKITALDITDSPQARDFVNGLSPTVGKVNITSVTVTHANGTIESETAGGPNTSNNISFASGIATVGGLGAGDKIAWTTSAPHDRVLIEGVAGKFDIGGFAITQASSASVDIGQQLTFEDDGPTAAIALTGTSVAHDETAGIQADDNPAAATPFASVVNPSTDLPAPNPDDRFAQSASAVVSASSSSFGADQENGSKVFSLAVASSSSGLKTTDGTDVFLVKEGDLVVGRIGGTDPTFAAAFAIAINSLTGVVSTAQYASLKHGTPETNGDASEVASITDSAVLAVVTVTDGDGDKATSSTGIGAQIQFLDDGPAALIGLTGTSVAHDESAGLQADDNPAAATPFASVVNPSTDLPAPNPDDRFAQSASAVVTSAGSSFGADQENGSKVFSLAVASSSSGLKTTDGTDVFLVKEGDLVVGRIGGTDPTFAAAFAIAINSLTGVVSTAQYASLKHGTPETNGDASEVASITDSAVLAVVTVTDGDGDKATSSTGIGAQIQFLDDGPAALIGLTGTSVAHDESAGLQADDNPAAATPFASVVNPSTDLPAPNPDDRFAQSASAVVTSAGSSFGADQENGSKVFSLAVASSSSGLKTTDGTDVFLVKEGDLVVGRIGGTDPTFAAAFAIAINSLTGVVSTAQYASLKHGTPETNGDASEVASITDSAVLAVVTVTDGDGDKATSSTGIGAQIQFLDDGPAALIGLTGTSVAHDESAGLQADDNPAAATPFASVVNPSTDLPAPNPDDRFAQSASAVVTSAGSSFGADQENGSKVFSLAVASSSSGLKIGRASCRERV